MTQNDQIITIQGQALPRLGFGTWQIKGADCVEAVRDALEIGYRHIDTARAYENEAQVGRAIADSGVSRSEIFLTTKLWREEFEPEQARRATEESLRDLGTDYVDLLLLHWPNPDVPLGATLETLVALKDEGKTRNVGVSNFPSGLLREALGHAPIFADQVEFHPFLGQDDLLAIAQEHDLTITAYSPLAHGRVPDEEDLREIGEAHGKTAGQVALRWLLDQPNVSAIPKASSHARRAENFDVWDFELSSEERERIDALPKDQRDLSPSFAPDWSA